LAVGFSKKNGLTPDRTVIKVADIGYSITSADPTMKIQIQGTSKDFINHGVNPEMTLKAQWRDLSAMKLEGQKLFESNAVWNLFQRNGNYLFSFTSRALGPVPYKVAQIQKDLTRGEVFLHRPYFNQDKSIYPLAFPLDELLCIHYLALGRGAEIHACGVIDSLGKGHMFVGQSGEGKTTMARLWQNEPACTVLSDDRIILRRIGKELWMYGTPWHGEAGLASSARAPLTQIYFLQPSRVNELVQMDTTEAMARLISCSFLPFYNPEALEFTLGFFEEVTGVVPCYGLKFFPDKKVVEFIKNLKD